MTVSIIEKVLGNTNFYTEKYLKDTLNLTKSILIVSHREAILYNKYAELKYPSSTIDYDKKYTWRYYKHLAGKYHPIDKPIKLISIDNSQEITLSASIAKLHSTTCRELLKYDTYYSTLVAKYPEQELLIRAIICGVHADERSIVAYKDYTIVHYNTSLIESNEDDLIYQLQLRIYTYSNLRLLTQYVNADTLYFASMYAVLYSYIYTTLLSLRHANAKTLKAHTYHILNYLSSHFNLDLYYIHLTKKQSLYLYRNLLYLSNHAGREVVFRELIDKLFTDRNISVVTYKYNQINKLKNNSIEYTFTQKLLNSKSLVHSYKNFTLEDIRSKEILIREVSKDELERNLPSIDFKLRNSLYNTLLTKDLETIIIDNTDTVKYKLIPLMIEYWAYMLSTGRLSFMCKILDPVSNVELNLTAADLFKLYTIALYNRAGYDIEEFPVYGISKVFSEDLPSPSVVRGRFYDHSTDYYRYVEYILESIPTYSNIVTASQFEEFITRVYILNIGLSLFMNNLDNQHSSVQYESLVKSIEYTGVYDFNDESVAKFLRRIGLDSLKTYTDDSLDKFMYSILNTIYNDKLSFIHRYKYAQKALIDVFRKFNSYTVQIVDEYVSQAPILAGLRDVRYSLVESRRDVFYLYRLNYLYIDIRTRHGSKHEVNFSRTVTRTTGVKSSYKVDLTPEINLSAGRGIKSRIRLNLKGVNFEVKTKSNT